MLGANLVRLCPTTWKPCKKWMNSDPLPASKSSVLTSQVSLPVSTSAQSCWRLVCITWRRPSISVNAPELAHFSTNQAITGSILQRINHRTFHLANLSVSGLELFLAVTTFLDFSGTSDMPPSLKPLYKRLIAPVKSQLKTSRLAVVPYGVLHGLPFAALTPDGQHFLGDAYSVFYLPSVSVLPHIHPRVQPGGSQ